MKAKPTRIVWANVENDSDLEDGELPGEKADEYETLANPPRKQRKLAHGEISGKAGRQVSGGGSRPASKQEPYSQDRHRRSHPAAYSDDDHHHQHQTATSGPSKRKDHQRKDDQQQQHHHREPHRDYRLHEQGVDERKRQQKQHKQQEQQPRKQQHQSRLVEAAGGGGHGGGSGPSGSKSSTFEARKAALKARLESLMEEEPHEEDERQQQQPGSGGKASGSAGKGKGKQLAAAGASPAAAAGGGDGGGQYVASVYKEVAPSVEIKGAASGSGGPSSSSSPHPIRLADVQSLVLWVLASNPLVEAPRWVFVKNKPLIQGAVLVLASGLSSDMMREKRHLLPFLSSLGRPALVHTTPQVKPAQNTAELLTTKATPRNVKRKRASNGDGPAATAAAGSSGAAGGAVPAGEAPAGGKAAAAPAAGRQQTRQQQQQQAPQDGDGSGGQDDCPAEGAGGQAAPPPPPAPPPPSGVSLPPGPFPPSHYVASLEELKQHKYPLPTLEEGEGDGEEGGGGADPPGRLVCPPGFVATRPSGNPAARERMVALDCEMCITEAGFELTRITLVAGPGWEPGTAAGAAAAAAQAAARRRNGAASGGAAAAGRVGGGGDAEEDEDDGQGEGDSVYGSGQRQAVGNGGGGKGFPSGAVLLDELVVPDRPILDYNTRYSGITAQMLQGCTNRLEDIRDRFLALVPSECLLVGHALENDLAALRTCHCRVLDTAILFPHPKGPPFKSALKILARRFLRRTIQDGAHDSAVDARTALDLVILKIKHGPSFGCGSSGPHASAPKLTEVLSTHCGTRCCLVDRHDVLGRYVSGATAAVPVASDDDAVAAAGRQAASRTYGFVWTQMTELAVFMFRRARHKARLEEAKLAAAAAAAAEAPEAGTAAGAKASRGGKQHPPAVAANGKGGSGASAPAKAAAVAASSARAASAAVTAAGAASAAVTAAGAGTPATSAAGAATAAATAAAGAAVSVGGSLPGGSAAVGTAASNGTGTSKANGAFATSEPDYSDAALDQILVSYDRRLRRLWESLPPRYMLVIATGAGDTAEYDRLYEQKCKRSNRELGLPRWTRREEEAFIELGAQVLQSLCFAAVKGDGDGAAGASGAGTSGGGEAGRKAAAANGKH